MYRTRIATLVLLLMVLVFAGDLAVELGVAAGVPYVIPVTPCQRHTNWVSFKKTKGNRQAVCEAIIP